MVQQRPPKHTCIIFADISLADPHARKHVKKGVGSILGKITGVEAQMRHLGTPRNMKSRVSKCLEQLDRKVMPMRMAVFNLLKTLFICSQATFVEHAEFRHSFQIFFKIRVCLLFGFCRPPLYKYALSACSQMQGASGRCRG